LKSPRVWYVTDTAPGIYLFQTLEERFLNKQETSPPKIYNTIN
jgi:hypothetical protein